MTISGRHSAIAALSRGKSRISPQIDRTVRATSACSNRLGWVGGSSAYPVVLASSESSHSESQLPLKPVCPVRNTLRPFQNERLNMIVPHPLRREPTVAAGQRVTKKWAVAPPRQQNFHQTVAATECRFDHFSVP